MDNKPSIREKLEFLTICDIAIEEAKRISEQSKTMEFGENINDGYETIRQWEIVRRNITKDLIKDPGFKNYIESLNTPLKEDENESTLSAHPLK